MININKKLNGIHKNIKKYIKKEGIFILFLKKYLLLIFIILFYININKNINIKNKKNNFHPKISIFIPIYNKANYLKRSIRSLQIQTLNDIEIITVNDGSKDNSLEVLKEMAKNDSRIKIINNDKNRGLLYSRAMGILNSRGEYLMNLDPDDELEGPDNLEYLYKTIIKFNVDVISFGLIIKINGQNQTKLFLCSNFNRIQFQPNIIDSNIEKFDYLITNKLIKREIIRKAYIYFKGQINGEKWNYGEDEIWSSLINIYAKSKICINKTSLF